MRYTRYIVAASLLLASISACGENVNSRSNPRMQALQANAAQDYLDSMQVACRDGKEYLVGTGFRDNVVAPTGELCVR